MGVAALLAAILVSVLGLSVGSAAVVAAPKVTSFSPASGPVGTKVVVTGTAFTAATSVQFAGKEAVYTVNSATQITATVPAGATTGKVRVATTAGAAQSSTSFTVTKTVAPTTTGFSPTSGLVGTKVVITGTGFAGVSSVQFGGVEATYTVDSATQITATVPAGALSGKIRIANSAGAVQSSSMFTVTKAAAPTITGFSPATGLVGATVVIKGSGFTGANSVRFGGAESVFAVNSATQITATVPVGAASGYVRVATGAGAVQSGSMFTVIQPAPTTTGFAPISGPVGTKVVISGTGFTAATSVQFGGVASTYTVDSDSQITATVPAGAVSGVIRVTTPAGVATTSSSYTVTVPGPTVTGLSPATGVPGTKVVITGTGFAAIGVMGVNGVQFGGVQATFTVDSATQITATVPNGATSGPVTITTPSGSTVSPSFMVAAPPSWFSGISATSGAPGDLILVHTWLPLITPVRSATLNGVGVGVIPLFGSVGFGFVVPQGATSGPITFTLYDGTTYTLPVAFAVGPPPFILGISQAFVSGYRTIQGSGLSSVTRVTIGGVPVSFTIASDSLIYLPLAGPSGIVVVNSPAGSASGFKF